MIMLTYKFRIKDSTTCKILNKMSRDCNFVWNYCNEVSRKRWKESRLYTNKVVINKIVKGASKELSINQQTVQAVGYELETRLKQFRKALRFRGRKSLGWVPFNGQTIKYVGDYIIYDKKVFKFWSSREVKSKIKTGSFTQDARGRWYVNLVAQVNKEEKICSSGELGIDLGLTSTVADSNGQKISSREYKKYEKDLGKAQRAKKKKQTKKIHAKIKNKRKDCLEKYSTKIALQNQLIVVGDVPPTKLAKTKMAKSVLDNSWSLLKGKIRHKTKRYGGIYLEVNEAYTSRTCSHCLTYWEEMPKGLKSLAIREYTCPSCGVWQDRDINAARNILRIGRDSLQAEKSKNKKLDGLAGEESPTITV